MGDEIFNKGCVESKERLRHVVLSQPNVYLRKREGLKLSHVSFTYASDSLRVVKKKSAILLCLLLCNSQA